MKAQITCLLSCLVLGVALAIANASAIPCLTNNVTACLVGSDAALARRIVWLLLALLSLKVLCAGGESASAWLRRRLELSLGAREVRRVFVVLLRATPAFFEGTDPEGVIRRLLRDAETLAAWRVALWLEFPLAVAGMGLAVATMFCGGWDFPPLAMAAQRGCPALAALVLLLAPTHFLFLVWSRRFAAAEQRQAEASESQYATGIELLRGIVDLRALNAFGFAAERMAASTQRAAATQSRVQWLLSSLQGTDNSIAALAEIVFIAVAARMIFASDLDFTYADYTGFAALQLAFHAALARMVEIAFVWLRARPACRRIGELERIPQLPGSVVGVSASARPPAPSLTWNRVEMYDFNGRRIAAAPAISVASGEHVALVGSSGCGKTTLLRIAARQLTPTAGQVLLGGTSADELPFAEYASRVALVPQRPFLFTGTVRENILLGRDDAAGRLRFLADALGIPPSALDRELGPEGRGLSGGQLARVALARAVFGRPQVLLLDEVTAALDELSERRVLDFLATECRGCTIVFVTHRHASMAAMDRVVGLGKEAS